MVMLKTILLVLIFFYFIKNIQLNSSTLYCPPNERNALFDFKQGFIDQTYRLSSWVGKDCCKWEGVTCDNFTGHVVNLNLRNPFPLDKDRLSDDLIYPYYDNTYSKSCLVAVDKVNPSLLELKHLNYLDLSWNNFSGITIPKFFGLFTELTYLNLSTAQFGGIVPPHLGNLSALHSLDLGTDYLLYSSYDNIPSLVINTLDWTSSLVSLRRLVVKGIELSNMLPDSFQAITSFSSLLELRFSYCSLKKIPPFHSILENLTSLTILDLSFNEFSGPIPSAILNMTSLKVLQLSSNQFSFNGSIFDELKNLNKLEVLDLSKNMFAGNMHESPNFSSPSIADNLLELLLSSNSLTGYLPNWLHPSKSLFNIIDLSDNFFEGDIPTSFSALQSLKELYLGDNQLSGRIPTSIGRMSALTILDLGNNQLSGDIPVSLGKLSNLKRLDLQVNQFNGSIPKSFGQLSQLTYLNLQENKFIGVVSELHLAKLHKLKKIILNGNSLSFKLQSGWVPPFQLHWLYLTSCYVGPKFPHWLQTQTRLEYLYMTNTGISDSIPNWFQNLTSLVILGLSDNQIYGKIPSFTRNMVELFLSSNQFEGSLPRFPSSLEIIDLSNNTIGGPFQTDIGYTLPRLRFLVLSNNFINGSIPKSMCKLLSLNFIDFSKNNLSGVLPNCWGDLHKLEVIDFSFNSLSGTIQRSFCHQSMYLTSLHMSKNNFHGEIPLSLQNCTSLSILDVSDNKFSGRIPTWIGQSLHSLRILKFNSNKYSGGLSPKLCHLNKLQVLDVADNNLSGNIPRCFGNFNSMLFNHTESSTSNVYFGYVDTIFQIVKGRELEYTNNLRFLTILDLSNNKFAGKIPEQLANLSGLFCLNLSRNHLNGSIPMKIGQMRSLESLDLSNNHLSGTIPQSISAVTTLSYLNLSNNNLSGLIPTGNQLHTFNGSSYEGNSELCGLPLEKKCIIVDRKDKGKEEGDGNEDGNGYITLWFYIGMALGCVVGFWGLWGVLLFKKNWRYVYFQFVNDIVDLLFYTIAKRKV